MNIYSQVNIYNKVYTVKYAYPFLSQIVYQIHLHVTIPN